MRTAPGLAVCRLVGLALLGVVLWRTGAGPFLSALHALDATTVTLGVVIAVPVTCACAWRWQLVARGLDTPVAPRAAVASCYRAQFLNAVLPGGVLGDLHRGVRHGRSAGHTGRGVRAVVWERAAGQVVQAVVAVGVLLALPSVVRSSVPWVLGALLLVVLGLVVLATRTGPSWAGRLRRGLRDDVRSGLLARAAWPGVVLASLVAVAGHVATFLVAARAVGVTASTATLLPLALLVLVAAGLPTNIAGWGPREGMAAWTFGAAGLGADQGLATAVVFGALVVLAAAPGAVVLTVGAARVAVRPGPWGSADA